MQGVYSSAAHLVPSLPSTSKRSRSSSPGGPARSAKKRALWTTHPHLLNNAQSSEVDRSSAPWSGHISASPIDWVSMTESLYLATPPAEPTEPITFDEPAQLCHRPHHSAVLVEERRRVEEGDDDEEPWEADEHEHHDGMAVDNDHEVSTVPDRETASRMGPSRAARTDMRPWSLPYKMTGTESTHDHYQTPYRQDHYATAHPHQAPPLYDHLAGSPFASTSSSFAMLNPMGTSMSRSASNSSSDHSSSSYSTFDSNRIQRQPMAYQMDTGSDTAHANHLHHRPAPATSMNTAKRAEPVANGWKVSMGYRADCEKCVMRVPGHYLHCHDGR
ncbi:BZ3500_MvSof-1268-A1-R1_Chr4-3g07425 [Microbotryum saponariae]|uniref:BZ3500_MvSof-1268-A1-R1_Chr4-3g07425 protein n=1 Tax=Microbotryum saponariae TaxID=289078 RepID=A0A2X0LP45_9BASI|nr:BZ3500_MvSof-1268-A1-R1_Chr4-3g07425 [Microbotryum saponariae]SDA07088.1 BZ3501_MvSof-1269-A2-R1_Chr4-2g07134 [Microbotryum saponariae]